jgi:hypothetical protein
MTRRKMVRCFQKSSKRTCTSIQLVSAFQVGIRSAFRRGCFVSRSLKFAFRGFPQRVLGLCDMIQINVAIPQTAVKRTTTLLGSGVVLRTPATEPQNESLDQSATVAPPQNSDAAAPAAWPITGEAESEDESGAAPSPLNSIVDIAVTCRQGSQAVPTYETAHACARGMARGTLACTGAVS